MVRFRLTGPPEDPAATIGWRAAAVVLATLFLNLFFWWGPAGHFYFSGTRSAFFGSLGMVTILVVGLFFLAPALATHRSRGSLFDLVAASFGSGPAVAFRWLSALFCLLWMAGTSGFLTPNILRFASNREMSAGASAFVGGLLMLFLFATGLQSLGVLSRLALFTDKLGVALLIVATIRVRRYLPDAWIATDLTDGILPRVAEPLLFIGPMALLAADFGSRLRSRKEVALLGTFGLALPMAGTLFAVALIQRASYLWRSDLGGLANIGVALFNGDSYRYARLWFLVLAITLFGMGRFAAHMCGAALMPLVKGRSVRIALLGAGVVIGAVFVASQSSLNDSLGVSAEIGAGMAAILSLDYFIGERAVHKADWVALISLMLGCLIGRAAAPFAADYESRMALPILATYGASLAFCLVGRGFQRLMRTA